MPDIVARIHDLCTKENIKSMYELSKLSGVPQSTLATIMLGKTSPRMDTIEKICGGLNVTLIEFLSEDLTNENKTEPTYDDKIRKLPIQAKKIIDTVIEVHQPDKKQPPTTEE